MCFYQQLNTLILVDYNLFPKCNKKFHLTPAYYASVKFLQNLVLKLSALTGIRHRSSFSYSSDAARDRFAGAGL